VFGLTCEVGLLNATDIVGGYRAWKEAGLPVDTEALIPPRNYVLS